MTTGWFVVDPSRGYWDGMGFVPGAHMRNAFGYRTEDIANMVADIICIDYPDAYVQPLMVDEAFWGPRLVG